MYFQKSASVIVMYFQKSASVIGQNDSLGLLLLVDIGVEFKKGRNDLTYTLWSYFDYWILILIHLSTSFFLSHPAFCFESLKTCCSCSMNSFLFVEASWFQQRGGSGEAQVHVTALRVHRGRAAEERPGNYHYHRFNNLCSFHARGWIWGVGVFLLIIVVAT